MKTIHTRQDLIDVIQEYGFVPLFSSCIKGYSVEENVDPQVWFTDQEGPWEWKGQLAVEKICAYGKFFRKGAGFVSLQWWPDFVNYRRDGYDFDARCDEGLAKYADQSIYNEVVKHKAIQTKELKALCGYTKDGFKGFDTNIVRLQMQTYLVIRDFPYALDKNGNPYGWGVSEYTTPELHIGRRLTRSAYKRDPRESFERMVSFLQKKLPDVPEAQIRKFLKI